MKEFKIDLIFPWVDGNDTKWQELKNKYLGKNEDSITFFREWDILRFVFRSIEKNLSWINRVHFVTAGHLPKWLDTSHPKLNIVNHSDYIPHEYLPTFSANPIILNMHRIQDLSENFIYSNDDILFMGKLESTDFFREGFPCDYLYLKPITETKSGGFGHYLLNNINLINDEFDMRECYETYRDKWVNSAYSESAINYNEKILAFCNKFPGFVDDHMPKAYNKESFFSAWARNFSIFDKTSKNKFRTFGDISEWYIRYRRLCMGEFTPFHLDGCRYLDIWDDETILRKAILSKETKCLCLNDSAGEGDFNLRKNLIHNLLEQVFPEQSSYEIYPIEKIENQKYIKDKDANKKVSFPEIIKDEVSLNVTIEFIEKNNTKYQDKIFIIKIASSYYGKVLQKLFSHNLLDCVELCKQDNFVNYMFEHSDTCVISSRHRELYMRIAEKYGMKTICFDDEGLK